jgi:hypothetical protein
MRSPSERALDARIAQGHANAATACANRPGTGNAAQSHLDDARRVIREKEERGRTRETRLPNVPLHPVGVSPASQAQRSNSILGPLDRQISEEPKIPPRNPARVGTAPVSGHSAHAVDQVCRGNVKTRSSSTPDASAENPGHNALGLLDQFCPRRRDRGREDSRLVGLNGTGPSKPGDDTVDRADGQVSPTTVS